MNKIYEHWDDFKLVIDVNLQRSTKKKKTKCDEKDEKFF